MHARTRGIIPFLTAVSMTGAVLVAPFVAHATARRSADFPDDLVQPTFSVSRAKSMDAAEADRIVAAVESTGADGHVVRFGTVGMTRHLRDGAVLESTRGNWRIPLATLVVPVGYVRDVGGEEMASVLDSGRIILGRKSAQLRGAEVGDVIVLRDRRFRPHEFTVGAIVNEPFVGWNDVMVSDESATVLGRVDIARVAITDVPSYRRVVSALARAGFPLGDTWHVRRSWDIRDPDGTLGLPSTKKLMGEFAFKPAGGSAIRISPAWLSRNIEWRHVFTGIPLRFNCNRAIIPAVQGALDEIVAAGLSSHIDVRNSNRYGGCYVGRYNRRGGNFGSPSRHAWGMAVDLNTVTNAQGAAPQMNCGVVRIFRKWGFAWGGNFRPRDGMHFEWVGESRDTIGYPSRYCPNGAPAPTTTLPDFTSTTTTSTFPGTTLPPTTTTLPITSNT